MKLLKFFGALLIVGGLLGLVFDSFSFTKDTHEAALGPVELSVQEKQDVFIPKWVSFGAIAIGGLLLVFGSTRR